MIRLVLAKELVDHLRDRRSVLGSLVLPVVGPLVMFGMFAMLSKLNEDRPLVLPVVGAEHAPGLIQHLRVHGVEVTPPPEKPERAVVDGDVDMVLVIDESYQEHFAAGKSARAQLLVDESRSEPRKNVRRIEAILSGFSSSMGALRLLARGISPELAAPLALEAVNFATPEKLATNLLSVVPLFLMMAALVGGMNVAIDTTAGERERGSLEPLLVNPISLRNLVLGKWLATVTLSVGLTVLTQLTFAFTLPWLPLEDLGLKLTLGVGESFAMLSAVLPLALFGSALQMLIATFARSFKEAQTYLNLLNLVPMAPSMFLMFEPTRTSLWMMPIPALAQVGSVMDVMRGDGLSLTHAAVVWGSSLAYCAACLTVLVHLLGRERIVFGRG